MIRLYRDSDSFPGGGFHLPDPFIISAAFGEGGDLEPGNVGEKGIQAGAKGGLVGG